MDLRQYFKKLRDTENGLSDTYPLVVSLETSDGGKAGTVSEVTREQAAKLIVENCARLANEAEKRSISISKPARRKRLTARKWRGGCR